MKACIPLKYFVVVDIEPYEGERDFEIRNRAINLAVEKFKKEKITPRDMLPTLLADIRLNYNGV